MNGIFPIPPRPLSDVAMVNVSVGVCVVKTSLTFSSPANKTNLIA